MLLNKWWWLRSTSCNSLGVSEMNMTRFVPAWLTGSIVLLGLATTAAYSTEVLTISSWGGKYKEIYERTFAKFEKDNDVRLQWITGTGDTFQLKARAGEVDVVTSDLDHSLSGEAEGLWLKLEPSQIPNHSKLFGFAKISDYSVASNVGDYVIVYNADRIKQAPTSWNDLWDGAYKGKVVLYHFTNASSLSLTLLQAKARGGSVENIVPGLDRMADLVKGGNVIVMSSSTPEIRSLFELGEAWIGVLTGTNAENLRETRPNLKIARPKEGSFVYLTTLQIPKATKKRDLAMKFVNYALDPEVQAVFAKEGLYAPTVREVTIEKSVADRMVSVESLSGLFPSVEEWRRIDKVRSKWIELWQRRQ